MIEARKRRNQRIAVSKAPIEARKQRNLLEAVTKASPSPEKAIKPHHFFPPAPLFLYNQPINYCRGVRIQ